MKWRLHNIKPNASYQLTIGSYQLATNYQLTIAEATKLPACCHMSGFAWPHTPVSTLVITPSYYSRPLDYVILLVCSPTVCLPEHILYPGAVEPGYQSDQWVSTKIPSWVEKCHSKQCTLHGQGSEFVNLTSLYCTSFIHYLQHSEKAPASETEDLKWKLNWKRTNQFRQ